MHIPRHISINLNTRKKEQCFPDDQDKTSGCSFRVPPAQPHTSRSSQEIHPSSLAKFSRHLSRNVSTTISLSLSLSVPVLGETAPRQPRLHHLESIRMSDGASPGFPPGRSRPLMHPPDHYFWRRLHGVAGTVR